MPTRQKLFLLIYLIMSALISTPSVAKETAVSDPADIEIRQSVLLPFFEALKNGDLHTVSQYLSTDMYNEYKKLLKENKQYSKFLRNYYRGAKFSMLKALNVGDEFEVDIIIEFPNGSQSICKWRVWEEGDGDVKRWQISDKPFKKVNGKYEKASTAE
jgi:hypothetical protein